MALERILAVSSTGGNKQLSDTDTARVGRIGAESATGPASVVVEVSSGATATLGASALTLSSGIGLAGTGSPTITGFDSATIATKVTTPEVESTGGTLVFDANSGSDSTMTFENAGAGNLTGTFSGDLVISGDLTVTGTQFITDTTNVQVQDNHLYLNADYETVSAETGGLVVNYLPTSTNDTVATGGFTAGVDAVSDPTIDTTGAAVFAATDLVQVAGAADPANDGLYEVQGHAANVLTLKSTAFGVTNQVEDFTNNQLVTDTTVQGTIRKVTVSVIRAGTDGVWETGSGSATPVSFSDLATGAGNSLQGAYDVGQTITLVDTSGDLVITLDDAGAAADFQVTDSGGDYILTDATNNSLDLGSSANAVDFVGSSVVMTGNPTVNAGTGQWDFGGNVDANAGLDVSGSALTIAAGATHSSGEFLFSGGNLQLNDSVALTIGTGDDLTISHGGTDTTITSATGDLIIDNTNTTGSTIIRLGTDTSATDFQVQNDSGSARFTVTGGTTTSVTVAEGVTFNAFGASNFGNAVGDAVDVAGTLTISGEIGIDIWTIGSTGTGGELLQLIGEAQTGVTQKGVGITIQAGVGSGTEGEGGDIIICAGDGGATNGDGGDLFLYPGNQAAAGAEGDTNINTVQGLTVNVGLAAVTGGHEHIKYDDDATTAGTGAWQNDGGGYNAKDFIVDGSLLTDIIDAFTATTLAVGSSTATLLTLGASDIISRVLGAFEILGSIDTTGGSTLTVGAANATRVEIADAAVITDIEGPLEAASTALISGILTVGSTIIGTNDGSGIIMGAASSGASTGSMLQLIGMTTAEAADVVGANGMMFYNTTTTRFEGWDGGSFKPFGAGDITELDGETLTLNADAVAGDTDAVCWISEFANGVTLFAGDLCWEANGTDAFFITFRLESETLGQTSQSTQYVIGPKDQAVATANEFDAIGLYRAHENGAAVGTFLEVEHRLDASASEFLISANNDLIATRYVIGDNNALAMLIEGSDGNDYCLIDTTTGSEAITYGNATNNPTWTLLGTGLATFGGDIRILGGDLTSDDTTFNLLNVTPTTINAWGAATTIDIGAATGTISFNNATADFDGDVNIDGGDLTTNVATFNLLDTTATTINAFGAATTLEFGANTGTTTVHNALDVDLDVNIDGGDLTTNAATFNLLDTNATTVNAFGAATTLEFGANTGTTTVHNSLDVDLDVNIDGGDLTSNAATMNVFDTTVATINFGGAASAISMGASTSTVTVEDDLAIVGDFDPTVADSSKTGFTNEWSRIGVLGIGHRDFTNETGGASVVGTVMMGDSTTDAGLVVADPASWTTLGGIADEIVADLASLFVVTGGVVSILVDATVAAITRWDPCYLVSTNGGGTAGRVSNDLSTLIPGDTAVCIGNFCATDGAPSGLTLVRLNGTPIETVLA